MRPTPGRWASVSVPLSRRFISPLREPRRFWPCPSGAWFSSRTWTSRICSGRPKRACRAKAVLDCRVSNALQCDDPAPFHPNRRKGVPCPANGRARLGIPSYRETGSLLFKAGLCNRGRGRQPATDTRHWHLTNISGPDLDGCVSTEHCWSRMKFYSAAERIAFIATLIAVLVLALLPISRLDEFGIDI